MAFRVPHSLTLKASHCIFDYRRDEHSFWQREATDERGTSVDTQILSVVISGISLIIAMFSVRMAWHYKQSTERLSANTIFASHLITIDRCLVDQPELWMAYDEHPLAKTTKATPLISARIDAYLYMVFNLLSTTYGFYIQGIGEHRMRKEDREYWEAWKHYARQVMEDSSRARELFKYSATQALYPTSFVAFMNGLIGEVEEASIK